MCDKGFGSVEAIEDSDDLLQSSSSSYDLQEPCCFPLNDNAKSSIRILDFVKDHRTDMVQFLNSCAGLILCHCVKQSLTGNCVDKYRVCNPTTKQFNSLLSPYMYSLDLSLAFDHSKSLHYKVISVGCFARIEIYTLQKPTPGGYLKLSFQYHLSAI